MTSEIKTPKKLIEVALPLDAINTAAAKEKSIRHGHPSTIHLWWARRPLAAARAVLFAQLVNDPGYERYLGRGINKELASKERERLFQIIEKLVSWENLHNEDLLNEARNEILKSWRETCALNKDHSEAKKLFNPDLLPAFHDPFAGGGAIPLEAQRLGLEAWASDLNPVAVLINRAMLDIPQRFRDRSPIGPDEFSDRGTEPFSWIGARGIAEDVRRYSGWIQARLKERIGHLYPAVDLPKEYGGGKANAIAWLWARTVKCASPACGLMTPLLSAFVLSSKEGREKYLKVESKGSEIAVSIVSEPNGLGDVHSGLKRGTSGIFECLHCKTVTTRDYVAEQGMQHRLGAVPLAAVAEYSRGRVYLPIANAVPDVDVSSLDLEGLECALAPNPRDVWCRNFGLTRPVDLFTKRQAVLLTTLCELVNDARNDILERFKQSGMKDDGVGLEANGTGPSAYADAVAIYLAMGVSKLSDAQSSLVRWKPSMDQAIATFGRQAIPMVWDFAESNPFSGMAGDFTVTVKNMMRVLEAVPSLKVGRAFQADAQDQILAHRKVISTDPPYYDNIGYADVSDYFYVWLRRTLKSILPSLFASEMTPKSNELVAIPYRHESRQEAERFFLNGMTRALKQISNESHPAFPVSIYYAFKQSETTDDSGTSSTGWETFLEAVLSAGFSISGTWPMRTELGNRMVSAGTNALASSVVLVLHPRNLAAPSISRREFIRELNATLPEALEEMTTGGENSRVAPVDLSQAIIGPGMAIFSKYSGVLEADGKPMSIRTALQLINRFIAEDDFDHDTQFCLSWFDGHGWDKGKFGEADVLARAKGTSVDGLRDGGAVESNAGIVRLLRPGDLPIDWLPEMDSRISTWEILHHMIRRLVSDGEAGAGEILAKTIRYADIIRTLAYRLYTLCERKGWAQDAAHYNSLVLAWDAIEASARSTGYSGSQISFFGESQAEQTTNDAPKKRARKKK